MASNVPSSSTRTNTVLANRNRAISSTIPPHAIPFIIPTEDGKFEVNDEAIQMLMKINHAIAPIAVVGKYRTGKSFLLNKLIKGTYYNEGYGNNNKKDNAILAASTAAGFEVGPTIEACTRGIWLWSETLTITLDTSSSSFSSSSSSSSTATGTKEETVSVIFMDTEGLGSAGSKGSVTEDHDARIFALATLLSSLLVYNSVGVIDEDAISNLSFIANITRHVQVKSTNPSSSSAPPKPKTKTQSKSRRRRVDSDDSQGGSTYEEEENSDGNEDNDQTNPTETDTNLSSSSSSTDTDDDSAFPSFLWVLRDFTLELVDPDTGDLLTPRDYLESCLQQQPGFSTDAQARNRVRRVLTSFFRQRECATLVRPVDDENDLSTVDTAPETSLRPLFRKQIHELRNHILHDLVKTKTVRGETVTGRVLAGLAQAYVNAINNNAVPSISNAWDAVSRNECTEAAVMAYRAYENNMNTDAHPGILPLDIPVLEELHEKNKKEAIDMYENRAVGPLTEKYRKELLENITKDYDTRTVTNAAVSETSCANLISRLWREIIEPRITISTNNDTSASTTDKTRRTSTNKNNNDNKASSGAAATSTNLSAPSASNIYKNHEEFAMDMLRLRDTYFSSAKGPAVHKAFALFMVTAIPSVVRAVAGARKDEGYTQIRALESQITNLTAELQVINARATTFEAQCADLRKAREGGAVTTARAEEEARSARQHLHDLQAQYETLLEERDELMEKLKEERLAHADTRIQLRNQEKDSTIAKLAATKINSNGNPNRTTGSNTMDKNNNLSSGPVPPKDTLKSVRTTTDSRRKDSDDSDQDGEGEDIEDTRNIGSPRPAVEEARRRQTRLSTGNNTTSSGTTNISIRRNKTGAPAVPGITAPVEFPTPPPQNGCCSIQ